MTVAMQCPDRAALERLLEQGTEPGDIDRLAAHLETCAACGDTVDALLATDRTAAALRGATVEEDEAPVERLRDRLAALRPGAEPCADTTPPTGAEVTGAVVPSPVEMILAPPQRPDEIGRLGGYRILKELGRGGMGVVYQAEDVKLERLVALKAMLPGLAADAGARQRFLREARAIAAVRHDHVVTIFQVDEDRGVPFLAMEFLQGMPMDRWLKEGRKPTVMQVLRMGREIAAGLSAAHERGLIHRDVKPGNIWLDSEHQGRVKILDFGLARAGKDDVHLTRSGAIVGTPAYMAPEQARAEKVDARSDLFSLGCVLYRLCTGAMPFIGDTTMSLLMALALDNPKAVREVNRDAPAELSDLVMKLLEKDPARRPNTAREVVQAIQALEQQLARKRQDEEKTEAVRIAAPLAPVARIEPTVAAAATGPRRRRRLLLVAAAIVALAGMIWLGAALIRIQTDQGDYVIDTDDPAFFFQVHDGAVKLEDRKNNKTYTLKVVKADKGTGEFELEVTDGGDLVFRTKTFTIKRGEKAGLTAWFEPKSVAANPPGKVDDAWLKQVAALPVEKQVEAVAAKLKDLNPGFDGKVTPTLVERGALAGLEFNTDDVTDLAPLRALPGLKSLTCSVSGPGKSRLADLSPLKGMALTGLTCAQTQVSNLSPLQGMPLTSLDCRQTPVSDLSPLKGMLLTYLQVGSTKVWDLSPLQGMPLKVLHCDATKVSDLSPLQGMPLNELTCVETNVSDLSPLRGAPLTGLKCHNTPVSDLSPLKGIKLTTLECGATKVSDLSPLKGMPLWFLDIKGIPATDLSPLRGMPIKEIQLDFDPKRDADVLRSIPTLEKINGKPAADFWKDVDAKKP